MSMLNLSNEGVSLYIVSNRSINRKLRGISCAQSSLRSRQVPDKIHLLGSESSLSIFRFALKMKVAPLKVV